MGCPLLTEEVRASPGSISVAQATKRQCCCLLTNKKVCTRSMIVHRNQTCVCGARLTSAALDLPRRAQCRMPCDLRQNRRTRGSDENTAGHQCQRFQRSVTEVRQCDRSELGLQQR